MIKRSIKSLLGEFIFASHADEILLGNAAVVVAFHRIQAGPESDCLSISPDAFERHCRFKSL